MAGIATLMQIRSMLHSISTTAVGSTTVRIVAPGSRFSEYLEILKSLCVHLRPSTSMAPLPGLLSAARVAASRCLDVLVFC